VFMDRRKEHQEIASASRKDMIGYLQIFKALFG